VIHAVGPVWDDTQSVDTGSDQDAKLGAAVTGSLRVADELGLESISFPAVSTGIFGFPKERAARVLLKAVQNYFEKKSRSSIKTVRLVLFDASTASAFQNVWHDYFNP
jgi:putative ATPase